MNLDQSTLALASRSSGTDPTAALVVEGDSWEDCWHRTLTAFERLSDAYYGEARSLIDATVAQLVTDFFRCCAQLEACAARDVRFAERSTSLHDFCATNLAVQICAALATNGTEPEPRRLKARIARTYTEPGGRALAIIEYSRGGERPKTIDALLTAENCVNAWTRFIRKQAWDTARHDVDTASNVNRRGV
jgi:hypothetical protein